MVVGVLLWSGCDVPFRASGPCCGSETEAADFGTKCVTRAIAQRLIKWVSEGKHRVISGGRLLQNSCSVPDVSA